MNSLAKHLESRLLLHMSIVILLILAGSALILPALQFLPTVPDTSSASHQASRSDINPPIETRIAKKDADPRHIFLPNSTQSQPAANTPKSEPAQVNPLSIIDFSVNGEKITINLLKNNLGYESSDPVSISFKPGTQCNFGDGQACIYQIKSPASNRVIFTSAHSGVGGEAEPLRNLIEGTGINQALYSGQQVENHILSLKGSGITIAQGQREIPNLALTAIIRIPPNLLELYMALPVEKTLQFAVETLQLEAGLFNQALLVLETCGWKLPDEANLTGLPNTTGSVYLLVIGEK